MSLTASHHYINRSLAWLKGQRDAGPVTIDFPSGWEQRVGAIFKVRCTAMLQVFNHSGSKDQDGAFYHEFLSVFVNGTLCKFEPMGFPDARTKAISDRPSPAYDLTEYFPDGQQALTLASVSSRLVAEVTFIEDFDLLDILAVCCSMHQNKSSTTVTSHCLGSAYRCLGNILSCAI